MLQETANGNQHLDRNSLWVKFFKIKTMIKTPK